MRSDEFTMIVPDLTRAEALKMKESMISTTKRIAPKAKGSVQVGKTSNFSSLVSKCSQALKGV